MRDRLFDVSGDVRRYAVIVLWIVERFGIFNQRLVIDEAFDGGTPEKRAQTHFRCPLMQGIQDIVRITGRCGETGMLKAIDTGSEAAPDFFRAMCVRDDRLFMSVG